MISRGKSKKCGENSASLMLRSLRIFMWNYLGLNPGFRGEAPSYCLSPIKFITFENSERMSCDLRERMLFILRLGFWREKVFKIVPVQVPTKIEMWQNYVAFVLVITYILQAMWPYVVHILIIDHRPLLSMGVPRVCALTSSSGDGESGILIRAPAEQRISRSAVTERDRRVIVIRTCRTCWA
jgi:hypothetical protein